MSLISFCVIVVIVCLIAWGFTWLLANVIHAPPVFVKIIWGLAIFIIIVLLLQALGILGGADIMIPRIR